MRRRAHTITLIAATILTTTTACGSSSEPDNTPTPYKLTDLRTCATKQGSKTEQQAANHIIRLDETTSVKIHTNYTGGATGDHVPDANALITLYATCNPSTTGGERVVVYDRDGHVMTDGSH